MSNVNEMKTAKLVVLGAMSEASDQEKANYATAYKEIKEVLERTGEGGLCAMIVLTAEQAGA